MKSEPLRVRRVAKSPYQTAQGLNEEKRALKSIGAELIDLEQSEQKAQVWISNTHINFKNSAALYQQLPQHLQNELEQLQLIIHPNSGIDNFSTQFVADAKFPIISGQSIRAHAVAEWYLGELLSRFSVTENQKQWSSQRIWDRDLLAHQEVLIIGHGHVGQILSRSLGPLVKEILIFDPYQPQQPPVEQEANIRFCGDLNGEKLPRIVLCCASLNPTSLQLINKNFLRRLPQNFIILNAARGALLDQEALFGALKESPEASASLDVFESEPYPLETLGHLPNIRTTSHIAGVFKNLQDEMTKFIKGVLQDFILEDQQSFLHKYQNSLLDKKIKSTKEHESFLC